MLFANKRVVEAVEKHFVAAWESVEPVKIAEFDLGDGTMVRGAYGGNIALYFCTPDGKVVDVLPGLHGPETVVKEIEAAVALHASTKDAPGGQAFALWQAHSERSGGLILLASAEERPRFERLADIQKKSAVVTPRERIDIVVPGGYEVYKARAHALLATRLDSTPTPNEIKEAVYAAVLEEPIGDGTVPDLSKPTSVMLLPE